MAAMRILAWTLFCICASESMAQDNPLKSAAKALGFATDIAPPADFVVNSRPKEEPGYIPVFRPPPEPSRKALDDKQLKAVKSDLDSIENQHDAVRQAFPPSAKAVAEEQAAKKAREKAKKPAAAR